MNDFPNLNTNLDPVSLLRFNQQPPKNDKLSQTALDFEAMLMTQLMQTMRKTVEPSGLFGDNQNARSTYEYLFDQAIFQKAALSGQTWGLAERLEDAWKYHLQEKEQATSELVAKILDKGPENQNIWSGFF